MVEARSSVTVPLLLNKKVIGIFNVESRSLTPFNDQDCQFAETFANHLALALHLLKPARGGARDDRAGGDGDDGGRTR